MSKTLRIDGRELPLEVVEAIVRQHFSKEEASEKNAKEVQGPVEDQWFLVDPQNIDWSLFMRKRADCKQEGTRKLIIEAYYEMKKHPNKYGKSFWTMFPSKKSGRYDPEDVYADHLADWVEQAL